MRTPVPGRWTDRTGTATVEFAVIAPFLVALLLGTVEVTRAIQVKNYLTDTARSGGRLAIQPGTSNADITSNINSILTNDGINSADATITVQVNGATTDARNAIRGDKISLKISVPINKINWVSPLFFPTTAVESEMLVMMRY